MFDSIENIKLISASQGVVKPQGRTEKRKYHTFIIRTQGTVMYTINDKNIAVNKGEMIFLPSGTTSEHRIASEGECRYFSISFEADISNPTVTLYSLEGFGDIDIITDHYVNLWKLGNPSERHKCYSLFYSILSFVSTIEHVEYSQKRKFEIISPAIEHLKNSIFDPSLKTDHLHQLCGISDTYFRKIFLSRYGCTPQKYIESKRISYARSLLEEGTGRSVAEISASVGYNDPLYFSRIFKKKYGVSPTNYISLSKG